MAIKKKEKAAQKRQSETTGSRKVGNSVISTKSHTHGADDKNKTTKTKAGNPQKMKSAEEQREVKEPLDNLPIWQTIRQAGQFLAEVRTEARKISWPDRSQVIRETISVLFLVTLITLFVWLFDLLIGKFIFAPLEHWGHLYGIGGGG